MIKIKVGDICKQLRGADGENPIVTITKIVIGSGYWYIYHSHKGTNRKNNYYSCSSEEEVNRIFQLVEPKIVKKYPIALWLEELNGQSI